MLGQGLISTSAGRKYQIPLTRAPAAGELLAVRREQAKLHLLCMGRENREMRAVAGEFGAELRLHEIEFGK